MQELKYLQGKEIELVSNYLNRTMQELKYRYVYFLYEGYGNLNRTMQELKSGNDLRSV